jgi:5-oxoprolinase (ATP-hydrolysing)
LNVWRRTLGGKPGDNRSPAAVAEGFLTIAVDNMAHAIKHISTQRGHDVQDYTLSSFGGAGSQHACLVADALGIRRILLHPYAGVLSALGMDLADIRELTESTVEQPLTAATLQHLSDDIAACQQRLRQHLLDQGVPLEQVRCEISLRIKAAGSDFPFLLPYSCSVAPHGRDAEPHKKFEELTARFRQEHQQRFGFAVENNALLVQSFQVEAIGRLHDESLAEALALEPAALDSRPPAGDARHEVIFGGRPVDTPFRYRDSLLPGDPLPGPAVIIEANSTIVIEPGWQAVLKADHNLLLTRCEPRPMAHTAGIQVPLSPTEGIRADPVLLELFNNLFMFIAEQMGLVLQNTAVSVNIKERLDFSCAIFNAKGDLVANAPHMPVHLGSMSHSIKSVINGNRHADGHTTLQPGDVIMLNDPYSGGTHLPDITVIKPVFDPTGTEIDFYVASRGHHADIGGKTPGSMPSDSRHIDEEGILLDNVKVVAGGIFQETLVRDTFLQARWPARNIDMTLADLKAQIAACEAGIQALTHIVRDYGDKVVQTYMCHVQDNAEAAVRRVIGTLPNGRFTYAMDNGCEIRVSIHADQTAASATIDFTGTSAQHEGNFNAPLAVVHAAVLYVFRCLVQDKIPLNEGCLKPLHIIVPEGCLLNPRYPAAVVAGNVEVSQAVVDTLLGALGVKAAAQGTMNNLTFGNEHYQYYETLCGGDGATASADGASAVHTHMTNSRLTDPEVLESRFPVLLEEFAVRRGSGGKGLHRGGDGIVRAIRFLEAMEVNLLTNRRRIAPFGLAGGEPGLPGINTLLSAEHPDRETRLPSQCTLHVRPGDTLVIATPGGGGFGVDQSRQSRI